MRKNSGGSGFTSGLGAGCSANFRSGAIPNMILALAMAGFLNGCGTTNPAKAAGDEDSEVEEARIDMEDSKAEYEACLRDQDEYEDLDCEPFKEMYDEDHEAYRQILEAKKAGR